MAGVRIRVEFDDREVREALDRLAKAGADLAPAMREIGEVLTQSAKDRFSAERAPDGTPWAPLSPATRARKRRNRDRILTEEGHLRGTLDYQAGADSVEVGSPLIYAGTHHFGAPAGSFAGGGPWGDIPARPFLADASGQLSPDDATAILDIIHDHLNRASTSLPAFPRRVGRSPRFGRHRSTP